MNKFSDYKKAVDILFGIGGWREIGGYIDENGFFHKFNEEILSQFNQK